jgi:mannosyltransferase OCH1-like enzyme
MDMANSLLKKAVREVEAVAWRDEAIAHRIHMTARSKTLNPEMAANVARIQSMNPGWALTIYDDADIERFIAEVYGPSTLRIYQMLEPAYGAARADLFRYLCVHGLGGLYLDLKSTTVKPLDSWLRGDDRFLLSQWDSREDGPYDGWGQHPELADVPGGEFQQWFVLASRGHPFLKRAITKVLGNIVRCGVVPPRYGRPGVLMITGPIPFTRAILEVMKQKRLAAPFRRVDIEVDCGVHYSCLPAGDTHIKLNGPHYSQQVKPVVQLGGWRLAWFPKAREWDLELRARRKRWRQIREGFDRRVVRLKTALRR